MRHANDPSNIDSRDTDALFGSPPTLNTVLDSGHYPTMAHGMMERTTGALRKTFSLRKSRRHHSQTSVAAMEGLEYRQLLSGTDEDSTPSTDELEQKISDLNAAIVVREAELAIPVGIPINWPTKPSGLSKEVVGVIGTNGIPDAVTMSPDGKILLTSSRANAGPLVVRNMETGDTIKNLSYGAAVKAGALSADGRFAAATYGDRRVVVWDIEKGTILQNITTGDYSNMITFIPNTTLVAFESDAGVIVYTMDYVTGTITELPVPSWGNVSVSGKIIAGSDNKKVTFYSLTTQSVVKSLSVDGYTRAISFSPDGKYVALGNEHNKITILDASTWNTVATMNGTAAGVDGYLWDLKFLQGGTTLAIIGWNGKVAGVSFADVLAGKVTKSFSTSLGGEVTSVTASADGSGMAVGIYQSQKAYAFSFPLSDGTRRDTAVITAEIADLTLERDVLQNKLSSITNAAESLADIDVLTTPWNIDGAADPFHAAQERGAALTDAVKIVTKLMTELEDDDVLMRTHLSDIAVQLSASLEEWTTVQQELLDPRSAVDSLQEAELASAPRLFANFRKVSEAAHVLETTIRSPYDQTYIELEDRTNQSCRVTGETIAHVGGTQDAVWNKLFERMTNGRGGEIFVRMYRDNSKSELLGMVSGQYNPDSNIGSVESQSGFGTMGSQSLLELSELGGKASLQSWQGMQNGVPSMTVEEGGLSSRGGAWTLDLHGAEHLVTNVSFTVTSENPDAPITVRFYRGTELIGLDTVASGSVVNFLDTEGITSVLVPNAMREMSTYARQFLDYFNTADGQWQERRSAGGAAATFFSRNSHIPVADRAAIVSEAYAGYLPYEVTIADLVIAGNVHRPQVEAEAPSIGNNPDLGRVAHPYWGQSGDTLRRGPSPGYLAVGRFSESAYGVRRDINKYSAVRITGTNGVAQINYVAYHTQASDTRLSPEYYEIFGNTVILKPGAPEQVVIYFDKEGGGVQGLNIDVQHRESMTREEIMPPEGMSIRTDILAIRNPNAGEGVGAAITEILDRGRPVTIGQGNVLMNVWNDGLKGGTVRVVTNPGTAGATEVSFSLAAGEGKSVAMKFIVPESGALVIHTILPDGTIITNGRTLKTEGDPDERERRIAIKQANGTYQLLWVSLDDPRPTVSDAPSYDPSFAVWKQTYIARTGDTSVADPENFEKAFVAYLETKREEPLVEMRDGLEAAMDEMIDGIGGSPEVTGAVLGLQGISAIERGQMLSNMLALYTDSNSEQSLVRPANADYSVRKDTVAAKLFLAFFQNALSMRNNTKALSDFCAKIQILTGVQAGSLYGLTRYRSYPDFLHGLKVRFEEQGYGYLFTAADADTPNALPDPIKDHALPETVAIGTNGNKTYRNYAHTEASPADSFIRIQFDMVIPSNYAFDHASIYLMYNGVQILGLPPLASSSMPTLSLSVPLAKIYEQLLASKNTLGIDVPNRGGPDGASFSGQVSFKAAVWYAKTLPEGVAGPRQIVSDGAQFAQEQQISIDLISGLKDLSTLPDTNDFQERRMRENMILNEVADPDHFVIRQPREWRWTIGSEYHHDSAVHAVDLNWGSFSDSDRGKDVYAPAAGIVKISTVNEKTGLTTLVIEHKHANGTVWYSKYLHMDNITLKTNDTVTSDMKLGTVSDKGALGQVHLHFEVLDEFFATVDMRKLLVDNYGMKTKALSVIGTPDLNADGTQKKNDDGTLKFKYTPNGAELQVDWDTDLNRWQSSAYGLVYGRDEQAPGTPDDSGSSYWYAKEGTDVSNMKRVMWQTIPKVQLANGSIVTNYSGWMKTESNGSVFEWKQEEWSLITVL